MNNQKITWIFGLVFAVLVGAGIGYALSAPKIEEEPDTISATDDDATTGEENQTDAEVRTSAIVDYLSTPELWNSYDILKPHASELEALVTINGFTDMTRDQILSRDAQLITIAKVGTLQKAPYEGQSLVNAWESCDGPCPPTLSRWAVDESSGTWTFLKLVSEENDYTILPQILKDSDASFKIPELVAPEILEWNENAQWILADAFEMSPENAKPVSLKTNPFDSFATALSGGCAFGIFPDGTAARYMIAPKFMNKSVDTFNGLNQSLPHVDIQGIQSQDNYTLMPGGGCGFAWSCARWVEVTDWNELTDAGTLNGTTVYTLKNPGLSTDGELNRAFADLFEGYNMKATYEEGLPEYRTLNEFLKAEGVYFAKIDATHGVMVVEENMIPAAECGKPVIYLYPEKAQEVSVKVNIDRFTKTIPAHGKNGWTVWAEPNGKLTNKADGQVYPYLFWESEKDDSIANLSQNFTLARSEIKSKLPVVLADLGLNKQEAKDFMIFWAPRMLAEDSPYLEIAFAGTEAMNAVAPLEFSAQPDTLLRIFMVYRSASEAGNSIPDFNTPVRRGFTAIEWGGLLQ